MILKVIVTSGGTISRIDDVRHIGNFSSGTTGALVAEEFLKNGGIVHYVYGKNSKRPFRRDLIVDPKKSKEEELRKIEKAYNKLNQYSDNLHEYEIETFEEYYEKVKELLVKENIDVIVLAAAVGDYGTKKQEEKISSENENLNLKLQKNPKIISLVKQWNSDVFQVGFKLLSRSNVENLTDVAYQHGIKNHSNLTVANNFIDGDCKRRNVIFITPEKGLIPVNLLELPKKLVEIVNQRVSKNHYQTILKKSKDHQKEFCAEILAFKENIKKFWALNLFESYFDNSDMHFGFLATRIPAGGFLITSRGSNKKNISTEDIVYVSKVDFNSRKIYVTSSGKKASLNANVAGKIFSEKPEVNIILHSHIFPGLKNKTLVDYSPGTQEDIGEIMPHLRNGERIVELINHGIISVGKNFNEVIDTLNVEPAYKNFPELYDVLYNRFQHSPEFVDLVEKVVKKDEKILDLAAGTGEVVLKLKERGYTNISVADKNIEMLEVLKKKIGQDVPSYVAVMQEMNLKQAYNAIIVRQAINYLMNLNELLRGLKKMYAHLKNGGVLIFNAPNFRENSDYGERLFEYEHGDYNIKVREMNLVENKIVTHTQNCIMIKKDGSEIKKFYDLNKFGLFSKEEFEETLKEAGFKEIDFFGKELTSYDPNSKTLYCVARK